ncbi:hypothetical protein VNO77_26989 [Canavalia gladiata]|uniref:Uncharacterized protein n=1 Tax=Canavalia gladiata TaxID=3824 RepID=A0AAN9KW43_CANGL
MANWIPTRRRAPKLAYDEEIRVTNSSGGSKLGTSLSRLLTVLKPQDAAIPRMPHANEFSVHLIPDMTLPL